MSGPSDRSWSVTCHLSPCSSPSLLSKACGEIDRPTTASCLEMSCASCDSYLDEPIHSFVYGIFTPNHDDLCDGSIWKTFSRDDHAFDSQMLLSEFINSREELRQSKFLTGVLVPTADLVKPGFQYSRAYKACSDLATLGQIMKQGGVCLVFQGTFPHLSNPLFPTTVLDQRDAWRRCVNDAPSTSDLIRQILLRNKLDGSYLDIIYQMNNPVDFPHFELEKHNVLPSPKKLPAFVQAKKYQMEGRRDWSHWDEDVCAGLSMGYMSPNTLKGLESRIQSEFSAKGLDHTEFASFQSPSSASAIVGHDFSSGYSSTQECGFMLSGGLDTKPIEDSIQSIFSCLFEGIQNVYKSPPCPILRLAMPL